MTKTIETKQTVQDQKQVIEDQIDKFIKENINPIVDAISEMDSQIDGLHDKSADKTYDLVAALVALAIQLNAGVITLPYEEFLKSRGITKPSGKANPFMAFIKAVFSVNLKGTWVFGKEQRSYEKHANHVRFLVNATRDGTLTGTVQDFIRAYPSKLKGIEAQDRKDNPNAAQQKRVETRRDKGRVAPAIATMTETFNGDEGDVVKLYGRVRGGKLEVLGGKLVKKPDEQDSIFYFLGAK